MADIAPQPSPTEGSDNGVVPPAAQSSSRPSSRSSPRTPNNNNNSILLPVLSEVTPSHGQGSAASRGSPLPAMLDGSHRSRSLGTMPMSPYPPRSAAISSRRGRSRSPTTTAGDRRNSSLSMHSSMGLAMHKNATMVVDHPAELSTQGPGGDRKIGKQDSRDDEQARAKAVGSGSASPDNISSAAAAAAAVAASFSSNGTKRPREDKASSSVSIRAIPTTGNVCFAQPPQKQGRTGESRRADGGSRAAWPVSPVHPDKGRAVAPSAASAVTSSSSAASGLSPTKFEEKEQGRSKEHGAPKLLIHSLDTPPSSFDGLREKTAAKDDKANSFVTSPLGPPEIQNSHRDDQQKSFSPKSFFADDKAKPTTQGRPHPATGSAIDISASFTLFNHSFDSLGGVMPDLDVGAMNSFGGIGANSAEVGAPVPSMSLSFLNQDSSKSPKTPMAASKDGLDGLERNKNRGQAEYTPRSQMLNGSSSGGGSMKLLGLSPNDSFGGGVMPVGGENAAMADLVLNGGVAGGGFFTGIERDPSRRRPQPQPSALAVAQGQDRHPGQHGYDGAHAHHSHGHGHGNKAVSQSLGVSPLQGSPAFYFVIRRWRKCFGRFTFILPGLKVRESCSVNVSAVGNITLYSGPNQKDTLGGPKGGDGRKAPFTADPGKKFLDPNPAEIEIATRRVIAAVCAFGGSIQQAAPSSRQTSSSSIFRTKYNASGDPNLVKSTHQIKYEEVLPQRYYENKNRLSWEVEENPPVLARSEEDEAEERSKGGGQGSRRKGGKSGGSSAAHGKGSKSDRYSSAASPSPTHGSSISEGDPPKMRYRCKLCGLPKQNHTCPYQQSLQRSIGTMTYPAVNAHSSAEPGLVAPALAEMNNFVLGEEGPPPNDISPPRAKHTDSSSYRMHKGIGGTPHNVTPEGIRSSVHMPRSPSSSLSGTPNGTPFRRLGHSGMGRYSPQRQMRRGEYSKMQGFGTDLSAHPLFIESMEIRPELLRTVTPPKRNTPRGAYTYPSLPLPYAQRKRLSDSLFAMSKEVPGLTDECAVVLREARQKGKWDLCVAELMTQVVITVHCRDGDNTLEGLRQYLLTLGIAC